MLFHCLFMLILLLCNLVQEPSLCEIAIFSILLQLLLYFFLFRVLAPVYFRFLYAVHVFILLSNKPDELVKRFALTSQLFLVLKFLLLQIFLSRIALY